MRGSPHRDEVLQVGVSQNCPRGPCSCPLACCSLLLSMQPSPWPLPEPAAPSAGSHSASPPWTPQVLLLSPYLAQLPVPCKALLRAAPAALCVIGKAIPEPWDQAEPSLRDTPHPWPPPGHGAADHNSLAVSIQPIPLAPHSPACTARPGHCGARGVCPGARRALGTAAVSDTEMLWGMA